MKDDTGKPRAVTTEAFLPTQSKYGTETPSAHYESTHSHAPAGDRGAGLWDRVLTEIQKRANPQVLFWFDQLVVDSITVDTVVLRTRNSFDGDWIRDNYVDLIRRTISELEGVGYSIEIVSGNDTPINPPQATRQGTTLKKDNLFSGVISPVYTFETFVVGPSNQFAHAASTAVAKNPGQAYNPLFIYGGVGLGKTHLLNAIGNHVIQQNYQDYKRICCISAEHFTNQVINSIKHGKMEELRNRYRFGCDVLMIDDIQFLSGKESTQEEFFHTFNTLYQSKKQIVLTSDKTPRDMPQLEERLRSRFQWGIITDIQPPEMETKVAILENKAEKEGIVLPSEVAIFIAESIRSNVRELEGTLINISAYAKLLDTEITIDLAKEVLKNIIKDSPGKKINIESIQNEVATYFGIKTQNLKSVERVKTIVFPRQVAMYLSRKFTGASYPEIGKRFGGKDHSTVIHAVNKIETEMLENPALKSTVDSIMEKIAG